MRGFLLHTAADTTNLGVVGPLFSRGNFEYIPIYNTFGIDTSSYNDFPARNTQYGRTLADFIPSYISNRPVHFDPDFENYTYGQPVDEYPRSWVLEKIREGDIVFFVCSLAPYDSQVYREKDALLSSFQRGKKNKHVFGFLTVKGIARVFVLKSDPKLALALLNVGFGEGGEAFLDMKDIEEELRELEANGYVSKETEGWRLTREEKRPSRSGINIFDVISDRFPETEDAQSKFLGEGLVNIEVLAGNVDEDIVKTSHHYRRLRSLDWDHFLLIVGHKNRSALLTRTVQLTERFQKYSFELNELGRSILKRNSDTLRGFRWIDEEAVRVLAREIYKLNEGLDKKLQHLL